MIIDKDDKEVIGRVSQKKKPLYHSFEGTSLKEFCRLALRHHRSISSSVIVESQCPERIPHIVITPPPEQDVFEAPYIAQNNQIPFQYHSSLPVPPLCILTCRLMTFEQWRAMIYHQLPSLEGSVNQSTTLVFSRSKFTQWVSVKYSNATLILLLTIYR